MAKRIFIIFHGRFPSEKAAALYAALHAQSLGAHVPVTILAPRRLGRGSHAKEHYAFSGSVRVVYLPTADLFFVPLLSRIAFVVSYAIFSLAAFFYLLAHSRGGDVVDTNEALPALAATLVRRTVYEMHDFPERFLWFYRLLLRRAWKVLATNEWKREELQKRFGLPAHKVIMERNGVDLSQFAPRDRIEARTQLGIIPDARTVVYTGHLYSWKGVDTLAEAAGYVPEAQIYLVGGTEGDVAQFKERYGAIETLHLLGHRPHAEIPLWLAAADVLVLPNTAREEISAHYTSPMKLFEYMASGRPIVASSIPSVAEILTEEAGFLVPPDDPRAMAAAIVLACDDRVEAARRAARARTHAQMFSWERRALRLLEQL